MNSPELNALLEEATRKPSEHLMGVLGLTDSLKNIEISDARIESNMEQLREAISMWKAYPDKFVDFLCGPNSKFKFYPYQRVFLRGVMRHTYSYMTFPRAYSKSFLSVLSLMLRAMLHPGAKLFITTGGKGQAASIFQEKTLELLDLIPAIKKEVDWKATTFSKDYAKLAFLNGSYIDVVASRQSSRGGRRHGGLVEECILVDGQVLSEVIIPM